MSGLPENWEEVLLDDVAHWGSGGTPARSNSAYYNGKIPWIKTGELGSGLITETEEAISELGLQNSSAKIFSKGAVAVAMYGATIGKTSILGIDAATNQACAVGVPVVGVTTTGYLHYYIQSQKDAFIEAGKGGAQPNISQGVIKEWPIPLPPFNEQKRIAEKLDVLLTKVDACRARLDRVPQVLKRFRQAVLSAATSGQLTEDWREENSLSKGLASKELYDLIVRRKSSSKGKFKDPAETDLTHWSTELPDCWETASVSAFAECLDSKRIPVTRESRNNTDGIYPYYGANGLVDMVNEYIFDDELVLVTEDETFYGRVKPIAYRSSGKCWVNNHAHVLRASNKASADYLCYCLMYYQVIPWLTGTTGRAKLTQAVLNVLPIGVPPQQEINEIVRRVETLFTFADRLEARYTAARKQVDQLTPSLLAKAFRGELVPQDPNDEPAEKLLERIQGAWTKASSTTAKNRKIRQKKS